jgi:RND family efflux transporter MFP subunit
MTDMAETRKPSWIWIALGVGALLAGLAIFLIASAPGPASPDATGASAGPPVPKVEFAVIRPTDRRFMVTAPGRLSARETLSVVGEVAGKIDDIHPDLEAGGRIARNEVLFRIEQGDYRADLDRARAQVETALATLEQAEANRDRQVELSGIGAVPAAQKEAAVASFTSAQASVSQARAQLTLSQRNLAKTVVRAPFDALVVSESVSMDTYVSPGAPLAQLVDAGAGVLRAGLSPQDVDAVRRATEAVSGGENGSIPVRAVPNDASIGNLALEGYLASFAPNIDPSSRTVTVRAIFPGAFSEKNTGRVFVDDFMTLEIEAKSATPLYELPTAALRRERFAWMIAADDTLTRVSVTPVENRAGNTLVTSPVDLTGQRVMVTPLADEADGMAVRPTGPDIEVAN